MRATLLVNPTSGGGRAARVAPQVADALRVTWPDLVVTWTRSLDDVAAAGEGPVVVLGGDGTIAHALDLWWGTDRVVAPLPGGRGNDLCRALGVDPDPVRAAVALARCAERRLDAALVTTSSGSRVVANVVSIGIDATASEVARTTRVPGVLAYVWGAVVGLVRDRPLAVTVDVDGVAHRGPVWFVSVSSSGWFGAGKHVAPSVLDDGLLDCVVAAAGSRMALVPVLLGLFTGAHLRRRGVGARSGRQVVIAGPPVPVTADGEPVGVLPAVVTVLPSALRLLVPAP